MTELTVVQYAAHRKEHGLDGPTRQAVRAAIESGRIHRTPSGHIDPDVADREWERNTSKSRGGYRPRVDADSDDDDSPADLDGTPIPSRAVSAAVKEHWAAVREELKARKEAGELISRAAAESVYFDVLTMARAALETIPVRVSERLVGLDAPAIRALLVSEIATVLRGLTDAPDTSASDD